MNIQAVIDLPVVPLSNAIFCVNCEAISPRQKEATCACCGSAATLALSAILNPQAGAKQLLRENGSIR